MQAQAHKLTSSQAHKLTSSQAHADYVIKRLFCQAFLLTSPSFLIGGVF